MPSTPAYAEARRIEESTPSVASRPTPTVMSTPPAIGHMRYWPVRSTRRPATIVASAVNSMNGISSSPETVGLVSATSCRNTGRKKMPQ